MSQVELDTRNAEFWNELCGSGLARTLGLTEFSADNLRRYDAAYLGYYPYLSPYVEAEDLAGKKVLEIGLGYGTLGHLLASKGCRYYGLDIAPNAVAMMRYRLSLSGEDGISERVREGSALDIPFEDGSFDYVYSIGCLHHTGNLPRAVSEIYRVLAPGGKAVLMLYNRHSFRLLVHVPWLRVRRILSRCKHAFMGLRFPQRVRTLYDVNARGEPAPYTEFVSRGQVRALLKGFRRVRIDIRNFDDYAVLRGRVVIPRERLLDNLGRVLGLDLYIRAEK